MLRIGITVVAIAIVVALGLVIDVESRSDGSLVSGIGLAGWFKESPTARPQASAAPPTLFAIGRIEGLTEEIELRPQLVDRVVKIEVAEGQTVRAGDPLLSVDAVSQEHEKSLAAAELDMAKGELERLVNGARAEEIREAAADLKALQAQLKAAKARSYRTTALKSKSVASEQEVADDTAQMESLAGQVEAAKARLDLIQAPARPDEVKIAQAKIGAAEAKLRMAEALLDKAILRSPCDGQILEIHPQVGEFTGPAAEFPAIILVDTTHMMVRAFVEELEAPRVDVGMKALITADGLPDRTFAGRVTQVAARMSKKEVWSDAPDEQMDTKVREVWIELDKAEGMVVGLRVDVEFVLDAKS